MQFDMTYNDAMTIQRAQMAYYRQSIGRSGVKAIKKKTICPDDISPDKPMSIFAINKLVPRGCQFEYLWKHKPIEYDRNSGAWHDAIRRGLI